ncbi:MAG: translation initiation factor IF-3 [Desulfobacteraceae bacterium]|nr:MAG: translation initiation factor IF-3 [Desulfobacteraceae bacterium]
MSVVKGSSVPRETITLRGGGGIAIPRRTSPRGPTKDRTKINEEIRAHEVRVIDPEGNQLGILQLHQALASARDFGLDLVEVSPNANPPVCKIMDYGRFRYEQTKKQQEAKKKQTTFQVKEIKLRPKTGEHDLQVKIGHIKKFLGKKDKVKVTVVFRGREVSLAQMGRELLSQIVSETSELSAVEQEPRFEGRTMIMILTPK